MQLGIDWRAALFAMVLAAGVSIGTGLMPAWLVLRTAAVGQLKQNAQGGGLGHSRLRSSLVVIQFALSLALLSVSATFIRTIQAMEASAPPALLQQVAAEFDATELQLTPRAARQLTDDLAARLGADSRVVGVSVSQSRGVRVGEPTAPRENDLPAALVEATPSYFSVMDIAILAGRNLVAADTDSAVVSAALAELIAPGDSPVGRTLLVEDGARARRVLIVGVAADFAARPQVARPDPVVYASLPATLSSRFTVRVRSTDPGHIETDVRAVLRELNPQVAWTALRRGDAAFLADAAEMREAVPALTGCAAIALLLAATGLYAVISYVVTLRRREIGVRLAIGASPRDVVGLVMRQAGGLVVIGAVAGLVLAVPSAFLMRATFVAPVNALDPLAFVPPLTLLIVVALAAAVIPSLRAARVNPVTTLREE